MKSTKIPHVIASDSDAPAAVANRRALHPQTILMYRADASPSLVTIDPLQGDYEAWARAIADVEDEDCHCTLTLSACLANHRSWATLLDSIIPSSRDYLVGVPRKSTRLPAEWATAQINAVTSATVFPLLNSAEVAEAVTARGKKGTSLPASVGRTVALSALTKEQKRVVSIVLAAIAGDLLAPLGLLSRERNMALLTPRPRRIPEWKDFVNEALVVILKEAFTKASLARVLATSAKKIVATAIATELQTPLMELSIALQDVLNTRTLMNTSAYLGRVHLLRAMGYMDEALTREIPLSQLTRSDLAPFSTDVTCIGWALDAKKPLTMFETDIDAAVQLFSRTLAAPIWVRVSREDVLKTTGWQFLNDPSGRRHSVVTWFDVQSTPRVHAYASFAFDPELGTVVLREDTALAGAMTEITSRFPTVRTTPLMASFIRPLERRLSDYDARTVTALVTGQDGAAATQTDLMAPPNGMMYHYFDDLVIMPSNRLGLGLLNVVALFLADEVVLAPNDAEKSWDVWMRKERPKGVSFAQRVDPVARHVWTREPELVIYLQEVNKAPDTTENILRYKPFTPAEKVLLNCQFDDVTTLGRLGYGSFLKLSSTSLVTRVGASDLEFTFPGAELIVGLNAKYNSVILLDKDTRDILHAITVEWTQVLGEIQTQEYPGLAPEVVSRIKRDDTLSASAMLLTWALEGAKQPLALSLVDRAMSLALRTAPAGTLGELRAATMDVVLHGRLRYAAALHLLRLAGLLSPSAETAFLAQAAGEELRSVALSTLPLPADDRLAYPNIDAPAF